MFRVSWAVGSVMKAFKQQAQDSRQQQQQQLILGSSTTAASTIVLLLPGGSSPIPNRSCLEAGQQPAFFTVRRCGQNCHS